MSVATKRKIVAREVRENLVEIVGAQFVARLISGKGNNLHEVETASGDIFLVSMPNKFRKNIWIKRGDYLVCEPIEEGDKVKAEIVHLLRTDNIEYLKEIGAWPFQETEVKKENKGKIEAYDIDDDMIPSSESSSEDEEEEDSTKTE